jgi:hypothetical protein
MSSYVWSAISRKHESDGGPRTSPRLPLGDLG